MKAYRAYSRHLSSRCFVTPFQPRLLPLRSSAFCVRRSASPTDLDSSFGQALIKTSTVQKRCLSLDAVKQPTDQPRLQQFRTLLEKGSPEEIASFCTEEERRNRAFFHDQVFEAVQQVSDGRLDVLKDVVSLTTSHCSSDIIFQLMNRYTHCTEQRTKEIYDLTSLFLTARNTYPNAYRSMIPIRIGLRTACRVMDLEKVQILLNTFKQLYVTFKKDDYYYVLQAFSNACSEAISSSFAGSPGKSRDVAMKELLSMYALKDEQPYISPKAFFLLPLARVRFHPDYAPIYIEVATEIEKHGIELTEALYGPLLNAFTKMKDEARLDWLEEKKKQASFTITSIQPYHSVIQHLLWDDKQIEAYELLQKCKADGLALDPVVYNHFIEHFSSQRLYTQGLDMYEEMKSEGVNPNARTYRTVFFLLSRTGQFYKQFEAVYEELKTLKVPLDSSIGTTVARTLVWLKETSELEWWIQELRDASVRFDPRLVNTWLSGYVESGDTGRMKQIQAEMEAEGFKPNAITIELMKLAESNERDPQNAQKLRWLSLVRKANGQ